MREIKFRAWDKINLKMLKIVRLDWASTIVICVDDKNTIQEIHQNNVEKMQFTGLKDKNGKEIYEGDVVHVVYPKEDRKFMGKDGDYIGKIKWIDDEPGLMIEQVNHPGADTLFESDKRCEVIGNIYENPELLK